MSESTSGISRNSILQFINVAHFLDHYFLLIFPTAALAIAPAWGMSYADTLALGTPLYVMFALATLPAGWLGDRMNRLTLIALFFVGGGLSAMLVAFSSGPTMLAIGLGLLGLFAAIYHPVGIALVTDIGKRTGRALAINGVFGNLGLAGAAVATAFLADRFGWRSAFAVPGALSLLIGCALWVSSRNVQRARTSVSQTSQQAPEVLPRNAQMIVVAVIFTTALCGGAIFNTVTITLPKFFEERLISTGDALSWVGASAGLVFALAAFAQLPVGELLDRYGAKPVLCILTFIQGVLLLVLSMVTGWAALIVALIVVTSIFASIPVTGWMLGRFIRSGLRSRIMSVEYVLSLGMAAVIVPAVALLHKNGYGFDFQLVALAIGAFIVLVAAFLLPKRPSAQTSDAVVSAS